MSFNQVADSLEWADNRRGQYRADVDAANAHYRATGDLKGFQALNTQARDSWHADVLEHFADSMAETRLLEALAQGGSVYATLDTGETVSVHNVGNLYSVSDVTGAPSSPLIARMVGNFIVSHTSVANLISRA